MFNIEMGKFLAKLRQEKNITQEQLAEMLHIDKRKISRWECGNSIPDFELLIKLQDIFDVTLYEMSICQRIEDEKLREKAKKKFKSIKDIKNYHRKQKLITVLGILFGFFIAFSLLFTIFTYNSVAIYELESNDEDFIIQGTYIKTRDYDSLNVTKVKIKDSPKLSIILKNKNVEIIIASNDGRFLYTNLQEESIIYQKDKDVHYFILNRQLNRNINSYVPNENDIFSFKIGYKENDDDKDYKFINYNFKITPKYKNNFRVIF